MESMILEGELEIDEAHLFKEKQSSAPHRHYSHSSQWLFGIRQRGTSNFIVVPVKSPDEKNLQLIILKHIKTILQSTQICIQ